MSDPRDLLRKLQAAASDDERNWLVTQFLLNSLPADLASMAYAAAIPHWFDAKILAALHPELADRTGQLYADLQRVPFVEPFSGRGHNVHELTRRLMLDHLWRNRRDEYVTLSRRAAEYFDGEADAHTRLEQIYHLLIADAEQGADAVWRQGAEWVNTFDYASVSALGRAVREHADAGRVTGRARGWGRYREGLVASLHSENSQAMTLFSEAMADSSGDRQLEANCIQALGDVHMRLSELKEARARYEEGLDDRLSSGEWPPARLAETPFQQRYRLGTELGRGGMGVVYRARDTLLDRAVAVKMLSQTGLGTEGRARLLREAQATAKLNHPNIVSVYDAGETDTIPFIVRELVEGEPLDRRRPATFGDVLAIARQVCAALEHAHAHGIIHRDLKPENVLIAPDGSAKLMDFGLAHSALAARLTPDGPVAGTALYLAPELLQGEAASPQSDLYAFGVLLYDLLTGRHPFGGGVAANAANPLLPASLAPPSAHDPAVPPALDGLVLRLLSRHPSDRPASAAEVLQVLESLQAAEAPALGDVHVRLSNLSEARARYEEALSIYRAIGDKLGEANCIRSLGDVHVRLSDLSEARARYEEALSIYRAIGDKLGEANCIQALSEVYAAHPELLQARAVNEPLLYIDVLTSIVKRFVGIAGAPAALKVARKIPRLVVDDEGNVLSYNNDAPVGTITALIDAYRDVFEEAAIMLSRQAAQPVARDDSLLQQTGLTALKIDILLVDDHVLFRESLASLLAAQPDMRVVGQVGSMREAVALARELKPHVVLMDLTLPDGTGVEATQAILADRPTTRVVFLTVHADDEQLFAAIRAGAAGYMVKNVHVAELLGQLRRVAQGEADISSTIARRILEEFSRTPPRELVERAEAVDLTAREIEIIRELAHGATNLEIAQRFVITKNTVKNHVRNVLSKLHLRSRRDIANYARDKGLIHPTSDDSSI